MITSAESQRKTDPEFSRSSAIRLANRREEKSDAKRKTCALSDQVGNQIAGLIALRTEHFCRELDQFVMIDELDIAIAEILSKSAQFTNKEIADAVGSTEVTIANRIRDMESRNILRVVMQRDLRALGFDLLVLLDIHVSQRSPEAVAEELAQIEEAASVSVLYSDPDIFLQLNVRDRKHLLETIENKVAKIKGISHWTANIALEVVKLDLRYGTLGAL